MPFLLRAQEKLATCFARYISRTNLPFLSLLTSSIFAEQKREEDPRRSSKPTSQSIESRM